MAGATFPTNFDSNISEVINPEVIFLKTSTIYILSAPCRLKNKLSNFTAQEMLKVSTDQIHRVMFHVPQVCQCHPITRVASAVDIIDQLSTTFKICLCTM